MMSDVGDGAESPDASDEDRDSDPGVVSDEERAVMKANLDHFTGAKRWNTSRLTTER